MFFFLLASFVINAVGVASDDFQTVKALVESVDNFLKDHHVTVLRLPNIGVLPTDPIRLRKGTLEGLDTMQVLEEPVINKKRNKDNSTTFMFFVNLGIQELSFHYDLESSVPKVRGGEVWLTPAGNSLEAAGIVVVGDEVCDARLYSVVVEEFGEFRIDISPTDIPAMANLTEIIFEYAVPKLMEVVDAAFEAETLDRGFQAWFSDFVCLHLKPKKLLDFLYNYKI